MLQYAREFAKGRGADEVHLKDLLAGLLFDSESEAATFLKAQQADISRLRERMELPSELADEVQRNFPLAMQTREVIGQAKESVLFFSRHSQVGSHELLMALLQVWPGDDELFLECGIDRRRIVAQFQQEQAAEPIDVDAEDFEAISGSGTDTTDLGRMIDASANRAREALRVLEDFARFVRDDDALCERLKNVRHRMREALAFFPAAWLLRSRQTDHDVGVWISTREEFARSNLADVVVANCKRAQEAIRSLEECAKVENANAAKIFEQTRYELYNIEKQFGIGLHATGLLGDAVLYWLVDPEECVAELEWMAQQAIAGGVQIIQLRDKRSDDRELVSLGRRLRDVTKANGALLIINDRPDIARISHADGVHLGQEDLSVKDARRVLGPSAIIGVSTHTPEQARQAVEDGADYIGVGPVFPSKTKEFESLAGLSFVRHVASHVRLPAFCIGGIDSSNLDQVIAAGGYRIAVASALTKAREPYSVARTLRAMLVDANKSTDCIHG